MTSFVNGKNVSASCPLQGHKESEIIQKTRANTLYKDVDDIKVHGRDKTERHGAAAHQGSQAAALE